jgi:hypothetical protein
VLSSVQRWLNTMPRRKWMYWTLFLLLVALKLPPASSSRSLAMTGEARQQHLDIDSTGRQSTGCSLTVGHSHMHT